MKSSQEYFESKALRSEFEARDTALHLICKSGDPEIIINHLDQFDIGALHLKNQSGLTPILCINDASTRNALLKKHHYICEAIASQSISALLDVINSATDEYKSNYNHRFFGFGLFRAQELLRAMHDLMDPLGKTSNIEVLADMLSVLINHIERSEGYYGFRHKGNLYSTSQDTFLVKMLHLNAIIKQVFSLSELDCARTDENYLWELRENLVKGINEYKSILMDHNTIEMFEDFVLIKRD
jgi:hypothetical protein